MKVAQLAVLGVAGIAAVGAGYIGFNLSNRPQEVREVVVEGPKVELEEVLVAARDISLGTSIKGEMFEWQTWPKEGIVDGYITRSENPDGLDIDENPAIARAPFFVGEPIREGKLVRADQGYMSAILPTGQRAIATSISTATSAGGFILPNDRVDVIMTRRDESNEDGNFITETILENVRVLAIDQTIEEKDGESVVVGETATLQLTIEQAKILTVAQQLADRMALALRSLEDSGDEQQTSDAQYLLSGNRGNGRVRIIKYGNSKDVLAGPTNAN
ncbi:MAG: Flp pilus assembly protein CpaB [Pseudomonadota bacterium]